MNAVIDEPRPSLARKALMFAVLAGLGGLFGFAIATFTDGVLTRWEDEVALLMAVILGAVGVIGGVMTVVRPSRVPKGCGVLQTVVMLLAAVLFLLPMLGTRLASPEVVFGAVVALLVVQSVANLMLWRAADEMLRRVMAETSALAFWAIQLALFLYAAAERLGLVQTISAWGLIGILMGVYFVASMIAAARRGIA